MKFLQRLFAADQAAHDVELLKLQNSLFQKDNLIESLRVELKAKDARIKKLDAQVDKERERYSREISSINDRLLQLHGLREKTQERREVEQTTPYENDEPDAAQENILWSRASELCEQKITDRAPTAADVEIEYNLMLPNWRDWISN